MSILPPPPVPQPPRPADEFYRIFFHDNIDGIWRLEVDRPIRVDQSDDAILDALYSHIRLAECNHTFARLYGKDRPEELMGGFLNDFFVRDDPASERILREFIHGGFRLAGAERMAAGPDGRSGTWADDLIGEVENGRLLRIWGTRRDVTAARQVEADLRRAKEAAEAASRAKSTFLANVSHEIRTPLNGVLGMAHLVLQDELSPAQRERVRVLKTSADSLLHVLNDLLDFSKIEAGKFRLSPIPFHLADELGETMKSLALRGFEKGLQLSFFLEPDVPAVVVGDPGRLRQMLVNLVGNAIKFTDRGEVAVRVRLDRGQRIEQPAFRPLSSILLCFSVQDTGIGIPAERLTRIFEPFEQAEPTTTRQFGGTGLGLAIVTRLAALMDGAVSAESEPGRGSTFRFTARMETTGVPKTGPALPPRLTGLRILVVDRHLHSRTLLVEQLSAWGIQTVAAANPDAALGLARESGRLCDLLVLDSSGQAGETLEMLRQLRSCGMARNAVVCVPPTGLTNLPLAGAEAAK
ncbi:MAG TPA: ATP-binding protein, partial [Gemmataceae bacterium]|nr:ATP-binding protein [Gemmataceae bacterium]